MIFIASCSQHVYDDVTSHGQNSFAQSLIAVGVTNVHHLTYS